MTSFQVQAALRQVGADIRTARLKRRLSVADFCARIGVTDKTLARLERGDGGVRLEVFAAALLVLGELHRMERLLDPARDDTALGLDHERLPQRIRKPRRKASAGAGAGIVAGRSAPDDEGSAF